MTFCPQDDDLVRIPVFISSTIRDLEEHRKAVINHLKMLDWIELTNMEAKPPSPDQPLEACLKMVEESQIYLGLIGWRYGTIIRPPFSVTECEYNRAKAMRLYRVVLLQDKHKGVKPDDPAKIARFRKKVSAKNWISDFLTPDSAAAKALVGVAVPKGKMHQICVAVDCSWEDFIKNARAITIFLRRCIAHDCGIEPEYVWVARRMVFLPNQTVLIILLPKTAGFRYLKVPPNKRTGGVVDAEIYRRLGVKSRLRPLLLSMMSGLADLA
ncbi:MAG TPA: DUF4062 domain-containing protein, partial [Candidatus Angelobacter sp.]|nr:DUF4062 domain-containing protein [Candidatus Angelobacter sp.]